MAATTDTQTTRISETEAARRLGVNAGTLRLWRLSGKLVDGLVTITPSPAPGGRPKVEYDEELVEQHMLDADDPMHTNIFA